MLSTLSHESHHLGIHSQEPRALGTSDSLAYEFLSLFVGEGTATKFINRFPGGCIPAPDSGPRDPVFSPIVASWWEDYTAHEAEIFERFARTLERAYDGTLTRKAFEQERAEYWLSGYVSRVYFVGAELFGAALRVGGKKGVFAAMRDVRLLLPLYSAAVSTPQLGLSGCPMLPDSTVVHAYSIGRTRR